MKIAVTSKANINTKAITSKVEEATRLGLRDTIVAMWHDATRDAPPTYLTPWTTGNNRRSLAAEVSGMGVVARGDKAKPEKIVDDAKLEAAVYSTSGYGGFLETGTVRMAARPYFRPALDSHSSELAPNIKKHLGA